MRILRNVFAVRAAPARRAGCAETRCPRGRRRRPRRARRPHPSGRGQVKSDAALRLLRAQPVDWVVTLLLSFIRSADERLAAAGAPPPPRRLRQARLRQRVAGARERPACGPWQPP
jgi:hypothetical protein